MSVNVLKTTSTLFFGLSFEKAKSNVRYMPVIIIHQSNGKLHIFEFFDKKKMAPNMADPTSMKQSASSLTREIIKLIIPGNFI